MARAQHDKPKAVRQPRAQVPKAVKPWANLKKSVKIGDVVNVKQRRLTTKGYTFVDISDTVIEIADNVLVLENQPWGTPWWSIHDWEIL